MSPEYLVKAGEVIGYLAIGAGGLFGVQWARARRNGHGNGSTEMLKKILHEVTDREGSVRSHGHQMAKGLQIMIGKLELMHLSNARAEGYLGKIAETLTDMRLEAAERSNCCEHCVAK